MRILGLDFGTKRIGVALSDELFMIAQGMDTIYRKELKQDLDVIADAYVNSLVKVSAGIREGNLLSYLECDPIVPLFRVR